MRRAIAVLAVLGLLSVACAGPATRPDSPRATAPTAALSPSPGPDAGSAPPSPAPEELRFEAPLLSGGTVRGATYAGADLVIWFWAPW